MSRLALLGGDPAVRLAQPHAPWPPPATRAEMDDIARQRNLDIVNSGCTGPTAALEVAFRQFLGGRLRYAVTFNSGTSALYAAYVGAGVGPGVAVLGPGLTYHAAVSPVLALGGQVQLADIDRHTLCIDPDALERAITPDTRVVVVVHQWGHPANMDRILPIVKRYGLTLIEDCSHAHGSALRDQPCGSFGDASVFSLQARKGVFGGDGGILLTNDDRIHERALLVGHPRERASDAITDPTLRAFAFTGFGLKMRMSPFNAIVALHSLQAFDARKAQRHQCLKYLSAGLAQVAYLEPPFVAPDVDMGAWYGFRPLYRQDRIGGLSRATVVQALQAEGLQVGHRPVPNIASLPLYTAAENPMLPRVSVPCTTRPDELPTTAWVSENMIDFPTFWDWDRDRQVIDSYLEGLHKVQAEADALRAWEHEHRGGGHGG